MDSENIMKICLSSYILLNVVQQLLITLSSMEAMILLLYSPTLKINRSLSLFNFNRLS